MTREIKTTDRKNKMTFKWVTFWVEKKRQRFVFVYCSDPFHNEPMTLCTKPSIGHCVREKKSTVYFIGDTAHPQRKLIKRVNRKKKPKKERDGFSHLFLNFV